MNQSIKRYLEHVTSLKQVNFYQVVQVAMKVERFEASSKERFQKKNFSRGASSSLRKRARESPTESVYNSAIRGRRQGPNVALSSGRGASVGQGETLECLHFHRRCLGICKLLTGRCFKCGSIDHFLVNCPKESRDNRSLQGSGKGRFVSPPLTRVEVARFSIEEVEVQCQRQWIVL